MSKKVAILFSGGLDSTYLMWKNLKDGNEVFPIYIEIENNETKSIMEKNRIKLLCKEFSKEFDGNKSMFERKLVHDIEYAIKVSVHANEGSLYFKQVPIWLFSVVFLQGMPNIEEIQIGYVANDDAISYLDDIQNIYKSYQTISEPMKPLVFPLTKKKKRDMAHELPPQYLRLIFSCENAKIIGSKDAEIIKYEACCDCVPCKHIIADDYYGFDSYPEPYQKNLDYQHVRALHRKGYKVIDEKGNEFWSINDMLSPNKEPYQLTIDFNSYGDEEKVEFECKSDKIAKAEYNG
jgi:hypothetical protein